MTLPSITSPHPLALSRTVIIRPLVTPCTAGHTHDGLPSPPFPQPSTGFKFLSTDHLALEGPDDYTSGFCSSPGVAALASCSAGIAEAARVLRDLSQLYASLSRLSLSL